MLQGNGEDASNWKWFRDVVVFLEEEKVRFYPRHKREVLRTVEDPAKWWGLMLQVNKVLMALRAAHPIKKAIRSVSSFAGLLVCLFSFESSSVFSTFSVAC